LVAGEGIEIVEDNLCGFDCLVIQQKIIQQSLDLYVSPSADNVAPNFTTIQKALDYLGGFSIAAGKVAKVNLSAGLHTLTQPIVFPSSYAAQVEIVGAPLQMVTVNNLTASGSTIQVTAQGPTTGLYVGNLVMLACPNINWCGARHITAISGSTITLTKQFAGGQDYNAPVSGTSYLFSFPSEIKANSCTAFYLTQGIGKISNLAITGAGYLSEYDGIFIDAGGNCELENVAIFGCRYGIQHVSGRMAAKGCAFAGNMTGVVMTRGGIFDHHGADGQDVYFNGNAANGLWGMGTSTFTLGPVAGPMNRSVGVVGNTTGVLLENMSVLSPANTAFSLNGTGVQALSGSYVEIGRNNVANYFTANALDVSANSRAAVIGKATYGGGNVPATTSPANGTVGNNQAYINVT